MGKKIVVLGNGSDWCEKSLTDFKKIDRAKVINSVLPCEPNSFMGKLAKVHFSLKINNIVKLPFKEKWYKFFLNYICDDRETDLIIIIYDRNRLANDEAFLKYLKEYFKSCKLVYMFTNIVKISGARNNNFVNKLNDYYDLVYAFDPLDAPKYNFNYSPLLYSLNVVITEKKEQVFYVGRAKDRYQMLMNVYKKLKDLKIMSKFYVFNVPDEKQQYGDEITYNCLIPYSDCLKYIQESSCLLDVIQGDSEGFTIKVCEAVFYDKLLITTNKNVKNAPFYDERFILVIESEDDIKEQFFTKNKDVRYSLEGKRYFSVENFVEKLSKDLLSLDNECG